MTRIFEGNFDPRNPRSCTFGRVALILAGVGIVESFVRGVIVLIVVRLVVVREGVVSGRPGLWGDDVAAGATARRSSGGVAGVAGRQTPHAFPLRAGGQDDAGLDPFALAAQRGIG